MAWLSLKIKEDLGKWLLMGMLLLVFIVIFLPAWRSLVLAWSTSDDYSHGFLVVPLCLYLLWQKKNELSSAVVKPVWMAFPIVLCALFLYLVAQYAEILTLAPLAMIMFIAASTLFLFGVDCFKICLFPFLLLHFMVPVPAQIYASLTIPLQLFVTKMTVFISSTIGVPILREGNVLYLPEHTLQVVQACSGLRSIMSLLTLGAVVSYFGLKSNISRSVLFVSAVPIAILVNVVRVLLMVIAFYHFDYDLAEGSIHTAFGAGIFALAIIFFLLCRKGLSICEK